MPPRPRAAPAAAAPRPERRRTTDVAAAEIQALDTHIQQQDESWKSALKDLEDRLFEEFKAFKIFIHDTLKAFTDQNALTDEQKTYLQTHTAVWHAETVEEVLERRAAYERTVRFVDGEEAHRAELAEQGRAAAAEIAAALAHDRKIAQRRWKVAGQLAAIVVPALLSLLGGVFVSQFHRLSSLRPEVILLFGAITVLASVVIFVIATYKLGSDEPNQPGGKNP